MQLAPFSLEQQVAERVQAADFAQWRADVEAVGGCSAPIHLRGRWAVTHNTTGATLAERSGRIMVPCGTRRAAICRPCSDRYAADAFHLMRAGLCGDDTKDIPASVTERPRVFTTFTAPSFGPVHSGRVSRNGRTIPCACGDYHHPDDPRIGTPADPESYDYVGAVLWNNHAGELWHRLTTTIRRRLAQTAGIPVSQFAQHARLSYGKVAEYQRRGLLHFHAVLRLDGPDGAQTPPPSWATTALLEQVVREAVASVVVETWRPDGELLELRWGTQLDTRPITATNAHTVEDGDGHISEARLAGYVAKYATKSTGATETGDRRMRSQVDIDHLVGVHPHHRSMIQTAWNLGGLPLYDGRNLQRWAHMLGFRGHFLTKSRQYSTTFRDIRETQADYRRTQALEHLGVTEDEVTVINHWSHTGTGYRNEAERDLATAIAERLANQYRQRRKERPE